MSHYTNGTCAAVGHAHFFYNNYLHNALYKRALLPLNSILVTHATRIRKLEISVQTSVSNYTWLHQM